MKPFPTSSVGEGFCTVYFFVIARSITMLNEQKNAILSLFNDALVSMGVDNAQILLERPKVAAHGRILVSLPLSSLTKSNRFLSQKS